ncbi:MAG: 4-phosphoerythronate dehydrogenase, partial [Legionella sp.]|nr:4-phosphoerythronate dehydrogenase [Legionella sp.]
MKILADASLPHLNDLFSVPFRLTRYANQETLENALPSHDILLCRSTLKITSNLLKNSHIQCVATASSGIDHIDSNYLNTQNIKLFDAKGCNASAVADYVLASLAYLKALDPADKPRGVGVLSKPRGVGSVGVIGAGEVGSRVIKRLNALGFDVLAYDPFKPNFKSCSFQALKNCDILCIHANLHDIQPYPTKNSLDAKFLNQLKPNTIIINAARGGIVDEKALLNNNKNIIYCTDVYQNEPEINPYIIQYATLCTPHIAGHSIEAKYNAVLHLSQKLHQYFGFKVPTPKQNKSLKHANTHQTWEALALSLYSPILETQQLKQATHTKTAFLALRRAH